ncbi:MAG: XRE family transcriptional regulator [Pseudohongiella sp.]|jgi:predicted XRE-type DNA-binding protein|nr:XRE family transcriptional regulator [Pseudohongiella sp.]
MTKSVFYQLYDDPKKAAVLTAKSDLMMALEALIKKSGLNNTQAADLLGVPRSRVSELMNGKIDKISLDALTGWLGVLSEGQVKVGVVSSTTAAHSPQTAAIA